MQKVTQSFDLEADVLGSDVSRIASSDDSAWSPSTRARFHRVKEFVKRDGPFKTRPEEVDPECGCALKKAKALGAAYSSSVFKHEKAWDACDDEGWTPSDSSVSSDADFFDCGRALLRDFGHRQARRLQRGQSLERFPTAADPAELKPWVSPELG